MVTLDLTQYPELDEVFRKVEAGEILHIMRGEREVMRIVPCVEGRASSEIEGWVKTGRKVWTAESVRGEIAD